jgi:hypothetical protein
MSAAAPKPGQVLQRNISVYFGWAGAARRLASLTTLPGSLLRSGNVPDGLGVVYSMSFKNARTRCLSSVAALSS